MSQHLERCLQAISIRALQSRFLSFVDFPSGKFHCEWSGSLRDAVHHPHGSQLHCLSDPRWISCMCRRLFPISLCVSSNRRCNATAWCTRRAPVHYSGSQRRFCILCSARSDDVGSLAERIPCGWSLKHNTPILAHQVL